MNNTATDFAKKTVELINKWNDPNGGATTDELRELQTALQMTVQDVNQTIALREQDNEPSFMELLLAGKGKPEDIHDFIGEWHNLYFLYIVKPAEIYEYLGMTESEYARFVEGTDETLLLIVKDRLHELDNKKAKQFLIQKFEEELGVHVRRSVLDKIEEIEKGSYKFHEITLQGDSIYLVGVLTSDYSDAIFKFPFRNEITKFLQHYFNIPVSDKRSQTV